VASLEIINQIPSKEDLLIAYDLRNTVILKKKNIPEDIEYITSISIKDLSAENTEFESETMEGMQYLGSGVGGSVYRLINDDGTPSNKAIKIVRTFPKYKPGSDIPFNYSKLLSNSSYEERKSYKPGGLKSMTMNRFQADFFRELRNRQLKDDQTPNAIPKVYKYVEGALNDRLRNEIITEDPEGEKKFPKGTYVAIWVMEYIPCIWSNEFCEKTNARRNWESVRELNNIRYTQENIAYNQIATFVLDDMGYVMKDLMNPRNFGFRHNGEVVFFDPVVIPYPSQNLDTNTKLMASLVYGFAGENKFTAAIEEGNYYKMRLF